MWMLFYNLCKPFTISPLLMPRPQPPRMSILLLIERAAWTNLSWLKRDWKEALAHLSVSTSLLRSESIHLAHCAKRCKKSWSWILRTRPVADRFRRQRWCGRLSLGRRIKGWKGWEVTSRKRRDGAGGCSWESFGACCISWPTSTYNESCNRKAVWKRHSKLCEFCILTNLVKLVIEHIPA